VTKHAKPEKPATLNKASATASESYGGKSPGLDATELPFETEQLRKLLKAFFFGRER
jgi:hypothetical protein